MFSPPPLKLADSILGQAPTLETFKEIESDEGATRSPPVPTRQPPVPLTLEQSMGATSMSGINLPIPSVIHVARAVNQSAPTDDTDDFDIEAVIEQESAKRVEGLKDAISEVSSSGEDVDSPPNVALSPPPPAGPQNPPANPLSPPAKPVIVEPVVDSEKHQVSKKIVERIERIIASLSTDVRGLYQEEDIVRVLTGAGVDRGIVEKAFPNTDIANTGSSYNLTHLRTTRNGTLSKDDLRQILQTYFAEAIEKMGYFDRFSMNNTESKAVSASRLVIESRIDDMTQKAKASDSQERIAFDFLHLFSIVYFYTVAISFNTTYFRKEEFGTYIAIVVAHGIWLVDIIWNVQLPARDDSGKLMTTPLSIIAVKWRWLLLDVLTLLPGDLILYWYCEDKDSFVPFDSKHKVLSVFIVWRTMKLCKVARLHTLFTFVTLDVITPWFVTVFFLFKPLLNILAVVILAVQGMTCLCLHLQKNDYRDEPVNTYIDQLTFVVSMLTGAGPGVDFVGYVGPALELILIACGLIAQAAVISNLSVTVFRNDISSMNIEQMRQTLGILEHFKVPLDVGTEILSYQLHSLNDDVSRRISTLETLPSQMQREVMLYVKVAAVNTVKLFSKATHDCKMKIAESLVQTIVPPTTDIVCIGDIGEEMFLIAHGYATVIIFNGMTVAMLSRGDYFGEVALLLPNNVRQATVRALTYCDLWVLDKDSFLDILDEFPGLMLAMEEDLLTKNIKIASLDLSKSHRRSSQTRIKQEPPDTHKDQQLATFEKRNSVINNSRSDTSLRKKPNELSLWSSVRDDSHSKKTQSTSGVIEVPPPGGSSPHDRSLAHGEATHDPTLRRSWSVDDEGSELTAQASAGTFASSPETRKSVFGDSRNQQEKSVGPQIHKVSSLAPWGHANQQAQQSAKTPRGMRRKSKGALFGNSSRSTSGADDVSTALPVFIGEQVTVLTRTDSGRIVKKPQALTHSLSAVTIRRTSSATSRSSDRPPGDDIPLQRETSYVSRTSDDPSPPRCSSPAGTNLTASNRAVVPKKLSVSSSEKSPQVTSVSSPVQKSPNSPPADEEYVAALREQLKEALELIQVLTSPE